MYYAFATSHTFWYVFSFYLVQNILKFLLRLLDSCYSEVYSPNIWGFLIFYSLVAQSVKSLPAMWVWSLGQEDPLEKEMETHSSILAWRIPWTEEPVGYSPRGRVELDPTEWWTLSLFFCPSPASGISLNLCVFRHSWPFSVHCPISIELILFQCSVRSW